MSDTGDTGTHDTGDSGDTGDIEDTAAPPEDGGTVEAGPPEEVILIDDGREIDVTDNPDDAFPTGSQVPDQHSSTGTGTTRPKLTKHTTTRPIATTRPRLTST